MVACSFAAAAIWEETQALLFQIYYSGNPQHANFRPVPLAIGSVLYYGFVLLTWSLLYVGLHVWEESEFERRRGDGGSARNSRD